MSGLSWGGPSPKRMRGFAIVSPQVPEGPGTAAAGLAVLAHQTAAWPSKRGRTIPWSGFLAGHA